ncbi:protein-glutamate O-methyltransferase CheR [Sinorhizobium numidicum]|uniref:Protein-glutamate O-methyltransferase CheR n=1 Tax=Sinorhizobium numidicum TaxID=680248 RepID=A0ABY8CSC7_9HYPH|nr:protein-glutamate O-methyltransferase CheR [Sinorhizobium numidicum]WEX75073.1 protein-glutamate O-methyltransferase CheR [Sinorhizobium numidicum]WEX81067.1 protein-glutamate O-methyltransferase CheR [Sinorhizobium numidicum]
MKVKSANSVQFAVLVTAIAEKLGLSLSQSREEAAGTAIRRVMARRGIDDLRLLLEQIDTNQNLTDELVDEVTVGESYFFRGPAQFDFVRRTVLPQLRRSRSQGLPFRMWSAGCAKGEEPYSLAILCEEDGLTEDARIAASDISRNALADAMKGDYSEWSLRNTDKILKERYFSKHGARFRLKSDLARRLSFTHHTLGADALPAPDKGLSDFDLILCRNVLVYLDAAAVQRIALQLYACLTKGGWLLTAPADPPLWKHAPFETSITSAGVVYRRPLEAPRQANNSLIAATGPVSARRAKRALSEIPPTPGHSPHAPDSAHDDRANSIARKIRTLLRRGDIRSAAQLAEEAIEAHPLSAELHYLQGLSFLGERSTEEAAAALRRVIYLDTTLAAPQFYLGVCLKESDAPAALHAFETALSLCLSRPPHEPVSLSDEASGHLVALARREIADLWRRLEAQ